MAEQEKDPLFPALPEDLTALSDDEVQKLLDDHVSAAALIEADDEEFLAGLTADEIIAQLATGCGADQGAAGREQGARPTAYENYKAEKAAKLAELRPRTSAATRTTAEKSGGEEKADAEAEVVAEADDGSCRGRGRRSRRWWRNRFRSRRPLAPAVVSHAHRRRPRASGSWWRRQEEATGTALVASAQFKGDHPEPLDAGQRSRPDAERGERSGPVA